MVAISNSQNNQTISYVVKPVANRKVNLEIERSAINFSI